MRHNLFALFLLVSVSLYSQTSGRILNVRCYPDWPYPAVFNCPNDTNHIWIGLEDITYSTILGERLVSGFIPRYPGNQGYKILWFDGDTSWSKKIPSRYFDTTLYWTIRISQYNFSKDTVLKIQIGKGKKPEGRIKADRITNGFTVKKWRFTFEGHGNVAWYIDSAFIKEGIILDYDLHFNSHTKHLIHAVASDSFCNQTFETSYILDWYDTYDVKNFADSAMPITLGIEELLRSLQIPTFAHPQYQVLLGEVLNYQIYSNDGRLVSSRERVDYIIYPSQTGIYTLLLYLQGNVRVLKIVVRD